MHYLMYFFNHISCCIYRKLLIKLNISNLGVCIKTNPITSHMIRLEHINWEKLINQTVQINYNQSKYWTSNKNKILVFFDYVSDLYILKVVLTIQFTSSLLTNVC